jgi:hypothetical protein
MDLTKSASGHITLTLCFRIWWDLRVTVCIPVVRGMKRQCTIFQAWVGPVRIPQKARRDTLCRTCVFAFGEICGSPSEFQCIRVRNVDELFFMFRWDRYGFNKNRTGTCYAEHVFLHRLGSVCHIMHSVEFGT